MLNSVPVGLGSAMKVPPLFVKSSAAGAFPRFEAPRLRGTAGLKVAFAGAAAVGAVAAIISPAGLMFSTTVGPWALTGSMGSAWCPNGLAFSF